MWTLPNISVTSVLFFLVVVQTEEVKGLHRKLVPSNGTLDQDQFGPLFNTEGEMKISPYLRFEREDVLHHYQDFTFINSPVKKSQHTYLKIGTRYILHLCCTNWYSLHLYQKIPQKEFKIHSKICCRRKLRFFS